MKFESTKPASYDLIPVGEDAHVVRLTASFGFDGPGLRLDRESFLARWDVAGVVFVMQKTGRSASGGMIGFASLGTIVVESGKSARDAWIGYATGMASDEFVMQSMLIAAARAHFSELMSQVMAVSECLDLVESKLDANPEVRSFSEKIVIEKKRKVRDDSPSP